MQAPITQSQKVSTPAGLVLETTLQQDVTTNGSGIVNQTDTWTRNGHVETLWFDRSDPTAPEFERQSPEGRWVRTVLNEIGKVSTVEMPGVLPLEFSYDTSGRLEGITQGDRHSELSYFSAAGHRNGYLESIVDPLTQVVNFDRDGLGRPLSVTVDGHRTDFSFDAVGNVETVTPPGKPAHSMTHTAVNLLESYQPPATDDVGEPSTVYTYRTDRLLNSEGRPDGIILNHQYEAGTGRLVGIASAAGTRSLAYDTAGRIETVETEATSTSYSYDGFLVTEETLASDVLTDRTISLAYSNRFVPTNQTLHLPSGSSSAAFGYDRDDLITCAALTGGTPAPCESTASTGRLDMTYDPGVARVTGTVVADVSDEFSYTSYGELARYTATHMGSVLYDAVYDSTAAPRDKLGRIAAKTETVAGEATTSEYAYDVNGRLTDVTENGTVVRSYAYDDNGNRTLFEAGPTVIVPEYDEQDRLRRYGNVVYSYTANGTLLQKLDESNSELTTYGYDAFGSLVAVELPDGRLVEYINDGMGRRVGKMVNGVLVRQFVWDGPLRVVAELDGAGNLINRNVFALGANSPDLIARGGQTYRVIKDHLGSPKLVVNVSDSSDVLLSAKYDEFGNVEGTGLVDVACGFAGGLFDVDTGLVRFGARDYEPEVGRWTSKDPVRWEGGQTNLYVYINDDPVNSTDRLGLWGVTDAVGWGWGLIGWALGGDAPSIRLDARAGAGVAVEFTNHPFQQGAGYSTTYGNVICYAGTPSPDTVAHELAHTRQYQVLDDGYLPLHIQAQILSHVQTGSYRTANPLESGPHSSGHTAWPWGG